MYVHSPVLCSPARRKRDETTQQTMMIGGVVGSILLVIVTFGAFMSVVCFKRGLFGVSTRYEPLDPSITSYAYA